MLYANEEFINDRGVKTLKKIKVWRNNIVNGVANFIRSNRLLIVTLIAFLVFSMVNCLMICTFFKILQSI